MSTVAEIEKLAFDLSENERAKLAERLLVSLRPVTVDSDSDVLIEAIRRSRELHENPAMAISLDELDRRILDRKK